MNTYKVTVIREGRGADFVAFWDRGAKVSSSGETLHPDLVGFTKIVEAKNLDDAISKVQFSYPGLAISRAYSAKVG